MSAPRGTGEPRGASGSEAAPDAPTILLRDVWYSYGRTPALEAVDLEVREGDFLGIIGPNAGGKTTLLRIILGLLRPERGDVRVYGRPPRRARGLVGYVPQEAGFDRRFPISVFEAVRMGRLGPRCRGESREREVAAVERALQRVALSDVADSRIGALSGGKLQRALIARALAAEPRVLLLDEPTASLDSRIGRSVYELLDGLSKEIPIVLVSHDIGVISRHVRTIACLNVRLHYHHSRELSREMLEATYGCPVDLLAHGVPHRVLPDHEAGR
ncbi:MAG: ATP-binding cassette domain-containing protein [Gemmatimonadota bacterium]